MTRFRMVNWNIQCRITDVLHVQFRVTKVLDVTFPNLYFLNRNALVKKNGQRWASHAVYGSGSPQLGEGNKALLCGYPLPFNGGSRLRQLTRISERASLRVACFRRCSIRYIHTADNSRQAF